MKFLDTNYCSETPTVLSASSQDASFPLSNLKHPFRSKVWRTTGCTSEWVVFDFTTAEPIDTAVLLWSKENGPKLTASAVITIQANATNVWTAPAVSQTLSINNTYGIASFYWATAQNYRYWRITIADPANPNGYVELGVPWIGASIPIQNANNGFKYTINDLSTTTSTAFGHTYVDSYPLQAQLDITYSNIDDASASYIENSFRLRGMQKPVLAILDPEAKVFNKDHFVVYGRFTTAFGNTQLIYNIFNTDSISILELS